MKPITIILSFFLFNFSLLAQQERFLLILGQDTISVEAGNQYIYVAADGRELPVKLIKQQIYQYVSPQIEFSYPAQFSPTKAMVADGVSQLTFLTEGDNGLMVYESTNGDPAQQVGLMMEELTKEKIGFGFQYTEQTFQRVLSNGKLLIGRQRSLNQGNTTETYTVASYTGQNNGILVVIVTNNLGNPQTTNELLDMFFSTLVIK